MELPERAGEVGRADDLRTASAGHLHPASRHQVREHTIALAPERDPAHRVRDVAIEAREEAKAVLAGQITAPVRPRPRHRHAPRFPSGGRAGFEDHDLEIALRELVRRAHPGDPASENEDPVRHPA